MQMLPFHSVSGYMSITGEYLNEGPRIFSDGCNVTVCLQSVIDIRYRHRIYSTILCMSTVSPIAFNGKECIGFRVWF